MAARGAAQ
jgi:hypothetical protein